MSTAMPGAEEVRQLKILPWEDLKGFEGFYKEHFVKMVIFCEGITQDKDLAGQLVQEAFCKIWENRHALLHVTAPSAYLYQTVRHTALDYIRKYRQELHTPELHDAQEEEERTLSEQLTPMVKKAAAKLPAKCRQIFEMSYLEGYSKEDIAAYLQISPLTVKKQRVIALRKIREELLPLVEKLLLLVWLLK
ncbi:RNA polymerase sigma-70 factor [Pontibacter mangrovi]|uniref:RNA polymerase sigma-70 factor n=1 Tax=Pontibacter mangrovi TaxID=2589816 RepID=A0A501W1A7_9BACT|nr:RNA polymerase sigma-70 factor [Pontibacter mangrovi]TPE42375.1 RNA polymerase sigma-70 factor [Pontibacter mangrovi]